MPHEVSLRWISAADSELSEVWKSEGELFSYMSRWSPRMDSSTPVRPDRCRWHAILLGGLTIGTLWVEREHEDEDVADLGILIGVPAHRGRGIGRKAIHLAEQDVIEAWSLRKLRLRVRSSNIRAIRCYKQCGYVESGRSMKSMADEMIEVIRMEHVLGRISNPPV
ncbi:MAG: GNAT family N-acetyltransferase [Verrucomicrobiaceae bacterium]|nr:MAG: GNAT family N-acetyltransferase [Verrucomicrobiaceae bacterium]